MTHLQCHSLMWYVYGIWIKRDENLFIKKCWTLFIWLFVWIYAFVLNIVVMPFQHVNNFKWITFLESISISVSNLLLAALNLNCSSASESKEQFLNVKHDRLFEEQSYQNYRYRIRYSVQIIEHEHWTLIEYTLSTYLAVLIALLFWLYHLSIIWKYKNKAEVNSWCENKQSPSLYKKNTHTFATQP